MLFIVMGSWETEKNGKSVLGVDASNNEEQTKN